MSVKNEIIKKVNKRVTKAKIDLAAQALNIRKQAMNDLARELLTLPFNQRFKLSMKILFKGKL
jgi:hypothetical protein